MKTTVNDDSLKSSLAVSAGLHLCFFLFLYFGLPVLFKPLPVHHDIVPFEIVTVADITNTRLKDEPEPPKPPEQPPPKPEQKVATPPPTPQVQQPPPTPTQAETLVPKPVEKKPIEPPKKDLFKDLLKNIDKKKPVEQTKPQTPAKDEAKAQQEQKSMAPTLSDRLTISEEDLLRRQIEQCWNMPIGAKDAQSLVVEVKIVVNPDRTVQSAEVVDKARMATDSFYRAAGEAAIRALYNPRCSPLELPPDKYEQWKNIDFNFDPRDM